MCSIINRPLCRRVLSSQHITLTCTGGILPQFHFPFFFFRLKTLQADVLGEEGLEDGWRAEYESESREVEKKRRREEWRGEDVGIYAGVL